ncbi:MAG: 2-amino-4-hydroxy-6-hydroxymethyldihydropteridine diphosphokinase [Bacillota bacterium]|nr:2-amino-4-hydroxy-6-hydroxymethyldihydropteridine diphosphokinase [Bacillota bacterium]
MDKMYIKDLEVYAFHGVNQEEKNMGQRFLISVELGLNLREAGQTDDLNRTVNYAELCHNLEREFTKQKYHLIEKGAEELANYILLNYERVENVKILLKKPWAPIGKPLDYAAVEIERGWHRAYIGLGSNLGDKEGNLNQALERLNSGFCRVVKVSNKYSTKPVGFTEQDDFLNCAAELKTLYTPEEFIRFLLHTEKELKRERLIKWGPRTIDLDVLLYDDIITSSEEIVVPHPRMHERLFVLKPLSEIAPYVMHPVLNKRIMELQEEVSRIQTL